MPDACEFYLGLLEQLNEGVYIVDRDRKISFWNSAAEQLTGYSRDEVLGSCCAKTLLRHVDALGCETCTTGCPLQQTFDGGRPNESEMFLRHKDGHRVPVRVRVVPTFDAAGEISGAAEIFHHNTPLEQMNRRLVELERLALLDPLTSLPNRRYLQAKLANRLDELRRYQWPFAVAFLDVDRFKVVNDEHGHQAGDEILKMVGRTLSASTRIFDAVGRWGGDEFMAVLANVREGEMTEVAERFRTLVSTACLEVPDRIQVTVSVGATLASPSDSVDDLVKRADQKMYEAKRGGRNRVCT